MSTLVRVIPAIYFFVSKSLNIVYFREAIKKYSILCERGLAIEKQKPHLSTWP